ncbi:hypothetical protein EUGRSUZ_K01147 [Eucalyptus grandis]|uniref:Uncharacterized protein n=2 Tax=Eucalyptus grandis TaxID=71139 RepID=A0ACC3ISD2_EUCGR|nr:hypothetical protein EUGRSUZ_K01147 [Eucalyptus grandis]
MNLQLFYKFEKCTQAGKKVDYTSHTDLSNCRQQLDCMKLQPQSSYMAVNLLWGFVHTAHHPMRANLCGRFFAELVHKKCSY